MQQTEQQKANVEAMKRRIREKAAKFHELLNNPVGKELINILMEEFDGEDLRGDTPEDTYYNLGARDVVKYLQLLQRVYERDLNNAT